MITIPFEQMTEPCNTMTTYHLKQVLLAVAQGFVCTRLVAYFESDIKSALECRGVSIELMLSNAPTTSNKSINFCRAVVKYVHARWEVNHEILSRLERAATQFGDTPVEVLLAMGHLMGAKEELDAAFGKRFPDHILGNYLQIEKKNQR